LTAILNGKRVFVIDRHNNAMAAWALVRRERDKAPNLIIFDHHSDGVQYGIKALEFAKGKNAIEVSSMPELVDALRSVRAAADAEELDGQIDAASASLAAGFKRKATKAAARVS